MEIIKLYLQVFSKENLNLPTNDELDFLQRPSHGHSTFIKGN